MQEIKPDEYDGADIQADMEDALPYQDPATSRRKQQLAQNAARNLSRSVETVDLPEPEHNKR